CGKASVFVYIFIYYESASLPNVAPSGTASQSTTLSDSARAWNAIDGKSDPVYYHGSCTHTAHDQSDPWWRLLLPGIYRITAVSVTNRDELAERINNAEIRIGNSAENNGNNNPRCAVIPSIPAAQTATFQCGGMEGRFVNVYLPGAAKVLTLCEVEVYGGTVRQTPTGPVSMPCLAGTASQSTTLSDSARAWKAIDGNSDPVYYHGSCTHTAHDQSDPWWRLLLPGIYRITAVSVTNRDELAERINNAEIRIGNSAENNGNNNPRCAVIPSIPAAQTATFQCGGMEGRFVNVYLPGAAKVLTLCEVEVYGGTVRRL
uniref:Fucolectin tachylectin-4 pentraxin-1 domain-containing protein n=1 Tax=Lates calcarifer TaxID=8187 RepID=A0A4W6EVE3_LATCA